jgi:hypothetical protein
MSASEPYEKTYERLKAETAEMFGLDVAKLSLLDELRLDLVSLLRLEVGALHGQALTGQKVDLDRLNTAHTMLSKLLPPSTLVTPVEHEISASEEAEIEGQWEQKINSLTRERELRLAEDPAGARAALEAEIAAALVKYPQPLPEPPWGCSVPPQPEVVPTKVSTTLGAVLTKR